MIERIIVVVVGCIGLIFLSKLVDIKIRMRDKISMDIAKSKTAAAMEHRQKYEQTSYSTLNDKAGNKMGSDEWYEKSRKREGIVALIMITVFIGILGFAFFHAIAVIDNIKIKFVIVFLYVILAWILYCKPLCSVFGKRIWVKVVSERPNVHFYLGHEKTRIWIKLSDGHRIWYRTREFDDESRFYDFFDEKDNPIAMYQLGPIYIINWVHRMF